MHKRTYKNDKSANKAKSQGYNARSVFKLQEIDQKYHLIKNNQKILDIGCFPGSFIQYCRRKNQTGIIIGTDLQELEEFKEPKQNPFTITFISDLLAPEDEVEEGIEKIFKKYFPDKPVQFDLLLSDAMGRTTGQSFLDHEESMDICFRVIEIAQKYLRKGGNLICKFFMGERHKELLKACKEIFQDVKIVKPDASSRSKKEFFIVCRNFIPSTHSETKPL